MITEFEKAGTELIFNRVARDFSLNLSGAEIISREHTGVGCITVMKIKGISTSLGLPRRLGLAYAVVEGVQCPVTLNLELYDGDELLLEVATNSPESFPERISSFQLVIDPADL